MMLQEQNHQNRLKSGELTLLSKMVLMDIILMKVNPGLFSKTNHR